MDVHTSESEGLDSGGPSTTANSSGPQRPGLGLGAPWETVAAAVRQLVVACSHSASLAPVTRTSAWLLEDLVDVCQVHKHRGPPRTTAPLPHQMPLRWPSHPVP